jgi:hypothetical protein
MCGDPRCDEGVFPCLGDQGCNGWGVTSPKGKRYRFKCKQIPPWAVAHERCHGTGMVEHGCQPLDEATAWVLVGGRPDWAQPVSA